MNERLGENKKTFVNASLPSNGEKTTLTTLLYYDCNFMHGDTLSDTHQHRHHQATRAYIHNPPNSRIASRFSLVLVLPEPDSDLTPMIRCRLTTILCWCL